MFVGCINRAQFPSLIFPSAQHGPLESSINKYLLREQTPVSCVLGQLCGRTSCLCPCCWQT